MSSLPTGRLGTLDEQKSPDFSANAANSQVSREVATQENAVSSLPAGRLDTLDEQKSPDFSANAATSQVLREVATQESLETFLY